MLDSHRDGTGATARMFNRSHDLSAWPGGASIGTPRMGLLTCKSLSRVGQKCAIKDDAARRYARDTSAGLDSETSAARVARASTLPGPTFNRNAGPSRKN